MSIMNQLARFILKEHKYKNITGDAVMIGKQKTFLDLKQAVLMITNERLKPNLKAKIEYDEQTVGATGRALTDTSFFALFCDAKVLALDVSSYEGAEYIHDMNTPLPDELEGIADFIVDGGTIDNVFDAATTISNISRMLRPGGRAVFLNAASYYPSCYGMYPPEWYFDYFAINNFADSKQYLCCFDDAEIMKSWDVFAWLPIFNTEAGTRYFRSDFTEKSPRNMFSMVIAEKGPNSTWDKKPVQYHYRSDNRHEIYAGAARRFHQVGRPIFSFETNEETSFQDIPENYRFVGTWPGSE